MCGPQSTATASALLIVSGGLDCKPDVICPHWPLLNNCLGHICYVCVCGRCNVLSSLLPPSTTLVVLLYSDISNFTFWSVNILECKIFLIGFLDELGNFKQKKVLPFAMQFFSHFTATDPLREKLPSYIVFCMYYTCLCFCVRRKMSPAENQSRGKTWYQEESLSHFLFPGADFYSS